MSKAVAVILARGGSKTIPQKNIINVNGKPLLHYSALASLNSDTHETWVSTDCPETKAIAVTVGCKVIDRPFDISGDKSKSDEALVHFAENVDFDILVFIQPTSPLIELTDINAGLFKIKNCDSVFSVFEEHWLPRWTLKLNPIDWDIDKRPMRQDIEPDYVENGAFYITTRTQLEKTGCRYGGKMDIVKMPNYRSFQVDNEDDIILIENLLKNKELK